MSDDISRTGGTPDFIIVAMFTPDYRPLAEGLAASIERHTDPSKIGYHLYAIPKPDSTRWHDIIMMKAQIVLRAMAQYPGRPVVFMDADCRINGDISRLADLAGGDVGMTYTTKLHPKEHAAIWASSRVLVVRPVDAAKLLMVNWMHLCQCTTIKNDETMLSVAISITPQAKIEILPFEFSAMEENRLAGHVPAISHVSAHSASHTGHSLKMLIRQTRRNLIARIAGRPYHELKNSLKPR